MLWERDPQKPTRIRAERNGELLREKVLSELLKSSIRGNEEFPRTYFGINTELLATAFESDAPLKALEIYFNSTLEGKLAERFSLAVNNLHKKYQVERNGMPVAPFNPDVASGMWKSEQTELLSFLIQLARLATGTPTDQFRVPAKLLRTPQTYIDVVKELMDILYARPDLCDGLKEVSLALRAAFRTPKSKKQSEEFKEGLIKKLKQPTQHSSDEWVDPIDLFRGSLIDEAGKHITGRHLPPPQNNKERLELPMPRRLMEFIALTARFMI